MSARGHEATDFTASNEETVTVVTGPPYRAGTNGAPILGSLFEQALVYAASAHRHQRRKGGSVPYVSHLLGVASLVLDYGGGETEVVAGLLHDCIEDCGIEHEPFILKAFGAPVLALVEACSDAAVKQGEAKPDWHGRKAAYLEHLRSQPASVLLVSACDKLHNARAILGDLRIHGQSVWERFHQGEADQLWYYRSLAAAFASLVPAVPGSLAGELNPAVLVI